MISAIILTHNSQAYLKACLQNLSFCQEIIVLDDYSTDKTRQLAQSLGAKVIKRHLDNDFASQRNFGLKKAQYKWVLFIDSDEIVPRSLAKEIQSQIKSTATNFNLKRQDWFLGRKLNFGETSRVRLTRLVQPGTGQWQGKVHEIFKSKLPLKTLKQPLYHQRSLTIKDFLSRLNHYTDIRAQQLLDQHQPFKLFQLLIYPPAKFLQNYILRLGFLDAFPGLSLAFLMSLHSLMVRIKLYDIQKKAS